MYQADILTVPANLAGLPALSVPCGTVDGMPVGLQMIGSAGSDEMVLNLGYGYEEVAS
jgi:aspartyl-tRNA(Asn)/glutamyl-tRNA(Gln) amidotransferase subunit A